MHVKFRAGGGHDPASHRRQALRQQVPEAQEAPMLPRDRRAVASYSTKVRGDERFGFIGYFVDIAT